MNRRQLTGFLLLGATGAMALPPAWAQHAHGGGDGPDNDDRVVFPASVTVSFGAGLNTAQPGNAANHHILPGWIRVRRGGVVNFVVAGFHQVTVYNPGKKAEDVRPDPAGGLFVNDADRRYYLGIAPAQPPAVPESINPHNGVNRVEPVGFARRGTYLVICNVLPHFRDGMVAYVQVR